MGLIDLYPQPVRATTSLPFSSGVTWRKNDLYNRVNWSWFEIVASTPVDYAAVSLDAHNPGNAKIMALAVGSAGAEVVKIVAPTRTISGLAAPINFNAPIPIDIPAGSRVSVAAMSSTAHTQPIQARFYPAPLPDLAGLTRFDYGPVDLLNGGAGWGNGALLQMPTVAHQMSAWREITAPGTNNTPDGASMPHIYKMLGFVFSNGTTTSGLDNDELILDLAHGAAGNEIVFAEGIYATSVVNWMFSFSSAIWIPWGRPAGERVSVRVQRRNAGRSLNLFVSMVGLK